MDNNKQIINQTKEWIEKFVIKLNLCPFAKYPFQADIIAYLVCNSIENNRRVEECLKLVERMSQVDKTELSNSFIIYPQCEDFHILLAIKDVVDEILGKTDLDKVFQVVAFHPDFYFQDEQQDAPGNLVNRSPYPMLHILREEEVNQAIESHDDSDAIPGRNKELLEKLKKN